MYTLRSVCVFCGSSPGKDPLYASETAGLGRLLAGKNIRLVYGGAAVGLMGVLADACLDAGGEVIGVIPSFFSRKEIAHSRLTDLRLVNSMHERKLLMSELSDGFISLPGGFGTMDELFEVLTWSQLDLHQKPVGLLNINGFYDPLLALFDHMERMKFVKPPHRKLVIASSGPEELLDRMTGFKPVRLQKWLNRIKA